MEPKDIETQQAEEDFRHQLRTEKEVIKISSNLPVISSVCPRCKSDKVHISYYWKKSLCAECDYQWEWQTDL